MNLRLRTVLRDIMCRMRRKPKMSVGWEAGYNAGYGAGLRAGQQEGLQLSLQLDEPSEYFEGIDGLVSAVHNKRQMAELTLVWRGVKYTLQSPRWSSMEWHA